MNKSLLYGLLIIACSYFRYVQSTPTFGKEYVHIKVHLPVEVRHQEPAEVTHSKHKHQHRYHKRRKPVQEYHGAKHSSGPHADDYLEALIVSTVMKPQHHHDDEKYLAHASEHVEPVDEYIVHHEHPSMPEHDIDGLKDIRYRQLQHHYDFEFDHQSYYRPQQHDEIIKLVKLHSKKPHHKYMPTVSFEDESNLETETFEIHHIPKPYHQPEIAEELEATKSQYRPSAYDDSTLRYAPNLHSDEDFHYRKKPEEAEEFLEIGAIYQPDLFKNTAQKFKLHQHKQPMNIEYIHTNPKDDMHQSHDEVRQVAEYPSTEVGTGNSIYKHSDNDEFSSHDQYSSHAEHSSHNEGSSTVTDGAAVADLPFEAQSDHHDAESYSDTDDYSATHAQGVGKGSGYHYSPSLAYIKNS